MSDRVTFVELDAGTDTYRFTYPSEVIYHDSIPSLDSVSVTPAEIEPGKSIGKRETVSVSFVDHLYVFETEAYDAGTFWTKFRARYPAIQGSALRVIRGTSDQALADMDTRSYVVDTLQIEANGASITAKDPLYQLNADAAQAPTAVDGELSADLTDAATSFTLTPTGIGNTSYPTSGRLCIGGEEVVSFTRSGDDITITERGVAGTDAQGHAAGARVQPCLFYDDATPSAIVSALLTEAGLDSTLWDDTEWTETDSYVAVTFGATITEPTSISKLLDELCEQAALVLWYDPVDAKINLAPLAPVSSGVMVNTDNILADSFDVKEQQDKRVSQVWVYYSRRNATRKLDETNNYSRVSVAVASNESDYPQQAIKKIFSRWISSKTAADRLGALQLARYSLPPRRFSFDLFPGDDIPELADGVSAGHWRLVDEDGASVQVPAQIVSVETSEDRTRYVAEEMGFEAPQIDPEEEGTVTVADHTIVGTDPFAATAGVHFSPQGKMGLLGTNVGATPDIDDDEWFTTGNAQGVGALYWIRAQYTGIAPAGSSSATDTWLALTQSRFWYIDSASGEADCELTIDISSSDSADDIVDTASISLSAIAGL